MPHPTRRIAHLDMDAFFASVELLRYPDLKGRPVVVGGRSSSLQPQTGPDGQRQYARMRDYAGRGVITTATYEARALGVHSGMGLMKAAKLAPDAVLLPADFNAYRHYSQLFKEAVLAIAPQMEDRGIDEIYLDLTEHPEDSASLAQRLKTAVFEATGLTCSICIAPNKLLAKIGSDLDKPDGLTLLLQPGDVERRIWPLPAKKINGIGPKAAEKLTALNIATIADLARADAGLLQQHFGRSYAAWLARVAQGQDERVVETSSEPKSLSRETTFERDLHARHDRDTLSQIFTGLCERVAEDLRRKGYVGRTIGIKLRYEDFRTVTRDLSLPDATDDAVTIRRAAGECLRRVPLQLRLRLLGVRVGSLVRRGEADGAPSPLPRQGELPL
ncbi:DNA polymerase IV [Noviherbaspirillum pedocola]|uniref:DNA polymerase IV n=1 Tax=Noviherbaspirillum pedocola TaxID=2801341 RepID=A0A934SXA8_9BURK|nr:DNA polymerase IV [Noviherbaspirillum pedocola]MBK4737060.1 DNA polymerase IV [Noviherbaspirillum pedocola]